MCGIGCLLISNDSQISSTLDSQNSNLLPNNIESTKLSICIKWFSEDELNPLFESSSFFLKKDSTSIPNLFSALNRRGPDGMNSHSLQAQQFLIGENIDKVSECELTFLGAVLSIRGDYVSQPTFDKFGNILLWNGEIFGGFEVKPSENDTLVLLKALEMHQENVIKVISEIQGPYAFTYWNQASKTLWFGRSFFGHRSLVFHLPNEYLSTFALCSTSFEIPSLKQEEQKSHLDKERTDIITNDNSKENIEDREEEIDAINTNSQWKELQTGKIYSGRFYFTNNQIQIVIKEHILKPPFPERELSTIPQNITNFSIEDCYPYIEPFLEVLNKSVKKRITTLPPLQSPNCARLGILFSGGIDSLVLAVLADRYLPMHEPVDLINVAFGTNSFDVPDRLTGLQGLKELQTLSSRKWNFIKVDINQEETKKHQKHILKLTEPKNAVMDITISTALWFASRGTGYLHEETTDAQINSTNSSSNLIDKIQKTLMESITTALSERALVVPPNFETSSMNQMVQVKNFSDKKRKKQYGDFSSPFAKLVWIQIKQLLSNASTTFQITDLHESIRYPQNIAEKIAYYFNKSSISEILNCQVQEDGIMHFRILKEEVSGPSKKASSANSKTISQTVFSSKAKVLLLGHGADEQLAGYGRHRTAFQNRGWSGLQEELNLDLYRLWERNLGRDDRIVSDNGKEARHPFLDEEVVSFLQRVPLNAICNLSLPPGIGDKMLLRQAAGTIYLKSNTDIPKTLSNSNDLPFIGLGLSKSSTELTKRAIQFGSRVNKVYFPDTSSSKINGNANFFSQL